MFLLNLKKSKLSFRQYLERTRLERQINYIQRVYYEPQYAREIRLFSMNLFMMKRYKSYFTGLQHMLRQQGLRMWLFSGLEKILNDCLYIVVTLFYLTGRFFAGAITIGGFSALFNGIFQFGDQIYSLLSRLPQLYEHSLYLETVQAVLNTRPSIENTSGIELDPRSPHSIELRHVTFAYPGRPPVFNDLNLKIEAGEQVALLGHNGAGKSTLIRLILRLYDPQEGQVLVDGHDVRTIDIRSLRSCFGVVLQDFQHFAFSIADNITLGRAQCDADKLQNALEQAQLADKIEPLPQGLATPVTREFDDSGIQLSGGEYQKLALARAYVQDSGILLFDEPSSALDPLAEHELFAGLRRYTRQKTVLYVCHKMSLAINADRAILLEQGRIIESGPPEDLLQAGGLYSQLYRLQAEDYQMKSVSMSKPY
jgi:ATP-binding cassette subfamily B protein